MMTTKATKAILSLIFTFIPSQARGFPFFVFPSPLPFYLPRLPAGEDKKEGARVSISLEM
jgi:hypothetical protein